MKLVRRLEARQLAERQDDFVSHFVRRRTPVVINGAARYWLPHVKQVWPALLASHANAEVTLNLTHPDGHFGRVSESTVLFSAERQTSLHDAWQCTQPQPTLTTHGQSAAYLFSGTDERRFSVARELLAALPDDVVGDRETQPFITDGPTRVEAAKAVLWLSAGGTTACSHRDSLWNFHAVLWGSKRFLLVPPSRFVDMKDRWRVGMRLREVEGGVGAAQPIEDPPGFIKSYSGFSSISLMSLLDRSCAEVERSLANEIIEASLHEGDVLFLPPGWWHEVSSVASASEGRSLSINYWQQTCFGVPAEDQELEHRRLRYLQAVKSFGQICDGGGAPLLIPAWMEAF